MRKCLESFYALIWGEPQIGRFRVRLYPDKYGDTRVYLADMDTEGFARFITAFGADLDEIFKGISPNQALNVSEVELSDDELYALGFGLESN